MTEIDYQTKRRITEHVLAMLVSAKRSVELVATEARKEQDTVGQVVVGVTGQAVQQLVHAVEFTTATLSAINDKIAESEAS